MRADIGTMEVTGGSFIYLKLYFSPALNYRPPLAMLPKIAVAFAIF